MQIDQAQILRQFQEETKLSSKEILEFLEINSINFIDKNTVELALETMKKKLGEVTIPEKKYRKKLVVVKGNFVTQQPITTRTIREWINKKEIKAVKIYKKNLEKTIGFLETLVAIITLKKPIVGIDISYYEYKKKNKDIFDEFDENIGCLPKRLKDYIYKLDLLLTDEEYKELCQQTLGVVQKRYIDGIKRRLEQSEKDDLSDVNFNNITVERLCKDFDSRLCEVRPEFNEVVEYKSLKILNKINEKEKKSEKVSYNHVRELIEGLGKDITEKADKSDKKIGNRKWRYTEGEIYNLIENQISNKSYKKSVVIKYIQKYRSELINNKP